MSLFPILRPLLFLLPPERAHAWTLGILGLAGRIGPLARLVASTAGQVERDPVRLWDLEFPNRIGLAAGYDKDGRAWRGLAALGFGHLELGTVTPESQAGNPRPRVFRLTEDRALVNRLGFPSRGAEELAGRLPGTPATRGTILGVNLGKQKDTPLDRAGEDYGLLLRTLGPRAGYVAVNVSSPNTPGLRKLQGSGFLGGLIRGLVEERNALPGRRVPLLVKLSPDLAETELDEAVDTLLEAGADGLIATNTTIDRLSTLRNPAAKQAGGLSGAPLTDRSTRVLERIAQRVEGRVPLVAAGGVMGGQDARRKRDAGADLVQLYTGLVYRGPGLLREVAEALRA